ncbi:SusC/RagA family TonB-linked outer membrane protein [Kriegella aquimaris]|uniref:TonB-linked outer membrane protein, SusC/RagA family n=1 Tax=Kriegella aquimaris TaxID=192904 RepID=A0A1G9PIS2_9FLAO|nr:TonB-dependent receptor [Kriegella aquimaris]SDL98736.1 TonB-linked outer membrane protein, SusC/RagA family [Kriegella aquimaris]
MKNKFVVKRKYHIVNYLTLSVLFIFSVFLMPTVQAQDVTVSGTVTAISDGAPLPGVSIVDVNDPTKGVVTDFDGNYTISLDNGSTSLRFSYIGFKAIVIAVNNQSTIDAAMDEDVASLDEVIVVGYGTQKRATVSGAVASVKGEELTKSPTVNVTNSLSGRVAGLFVSQASAEPGNDNATIRIRGTNTYNNTGALIVVDGIPDRDGGLGRINPADIESISVLKDASAAIYGARAANGVILVTTKRGKTGKPKITYSSQQGWAAPTVIPNMANAAQYAELRNELEVYNLDPSEWGAATAAFKTPTATYVRPDGSERNAIYTPDDIALFKNGQDPWGHPDTDWFGETFKRGSSQEKHTMQLTGGSENFNYFSSLGYLKQDAYYKNSATGYEQYDLRVNLDAKISEGIQFKMGVLGRQEKRNYPTQSVGAIFRMLTRGRPTEPAYWPNGLPGPDIENGQQPVVIATSDTGYNRNTQDYFQSNASLDIKIPWVEGLTLQTTAAIDKSFNNGKVWSTPWFLYTWDGENRDESGLTPVQRGPAEPNLSQYSQNRLSILLGANLQYQKSFGDHNMLLMAGTSKETKTYEGFNAYRRYFISPAIDDLFAGGAEEQDVGGGSDRASRLNYFGRVSYDFQEKYLLEFLWRYDGSYLFPEETRYGFFPGFSAGWVITKENWFSEMNNDSFLNHLKLRGSWGQLGNDAFDDSEFPANQFLATYGFGNYVVNNGLVTTLSESRVPNPGITWEIATNINVGLDARFIKNKMNLEFDWFLNKRTDILTTPSASLPSLSGISPPRQNFGEVENKGFDFILGWNDYIGEEFSYGITVNAGYAKNKILFNDEAEGSPEWQRVTGRSIGAQLIYGYDGVFATQADIDAESLDYSALVNTLRPGDMKILDYNSDGKITPDDRFRNDKNIYPTLQGGINLSASYKNFDLSMLFQGAWGGEVFFSFGEAGTIGNYLERDYNNRWSVDNPSSVHPRITNRGDQYFSNGNTYWRNDTDYMRLKNLELGYNIPQEIIGQVGLSNLRFYLTGSNLFTWTDALFDPEGLSGSGRDYPVSKILSVGFSVSF